VKHDRMDRLRTTPRLVRLAPLSLALGMLASPLAARADDAPAVTPPPEAAAPPAPVATEPAAPAPVVHTAAAPVETPAVAAHASAPLPVASSAPPPPPYSLPWQLRPLTVGNVVRSDTSVAFYKDAAGNTGSSEVTMLLASYKLTPELAPVVRLGFVKNDAPAAAADGSSFINPVVGLAYSHRLSAFRLAAFLGGTIPIGQGAGQTPSAGAAGADAAGINARSAMDNSMFAVNYLTGIAGLGFGYIDRGFTAQVEATLFQLFRVRGNDMTGSAADATRTNGTMGLHVGYFLLPQLSVGGELRYQRWLTTPDRIVMGAKTPFADANLDNVTFGVGPRAHFALGKGLWIRPGISYSQGLDAPLTSSKYRMVQVDLPVVF
jgi:hypothetical protein